MGKLFNYIQVNLLEHPSKCTTKLQDQWVQVTTLLRVLKRWLQSLPLTLFFLCDDLSVIEDIDLSAELQWRGAIFSVRTRAGQGKTQTEKTAKKKKKKHGKVFQFTVTLGSVWLRSVSWLLSILKCELRLFNHFNFFLLKNWLHWPEWSETGCRHLLNMENTSFTLCECSVYQDPYREERRDEAAGQEVKIYNITHY